MEQYVYSLKNQVADEEKLGGKLDDEEKETINDGIESTIEWLDESGEVKTFFRIIFLRGSSTFDFTKNLQKFFRLPKLMKLKK